MHGTKEQEYTAHVAPAFQDDTELIASVLKGDSGAAEEFVIRFEKLIRTVLYRMRLRPQEQEDIYQQVFIHLWEDDCRRLRQWTPARGHFYSFLRVVVAHLACDYHRYNAGQASSADLAILDGIPARGSDLDSLAHHHQQFATIRRALRQLKRTDASLIQYRHIRGYTYNEIASTLGMPVKTVGVYLARAEKRLRGIVRQLDPGLFDPDR